MPKIKSILGPITGKLGDGQVAVNRKGRNFLRKNVAKGSKKNEPALKKQYTAPGFLNDFASEINTIIKLYCRNFRPSDLYHRILSRFLSDPDKHRILQLIRLKGLEINPRYPLSKLGDFKASVNLKRGEIEVNLDTSSHPSAGKHKADSYYYDVLLLTWTKSRKSAATHSWLQSEWISIDGGYPEFTFLFPKSATTVHWLLCLGQRLGTRETEVEAFVAQGMQVVDVGTFDKKEEAMLRKMEKETSLKANVSRRTPVAQTVRVKAKRMKSKSF